MAAPCLLPIPNPTLLTRESPCFTCTSFIHISFIRNGKFWPRLDVINISPKSSLHVPKFVLYLRLSDLYFTWGTALELFQVLQHFERFDVQNCSYKICWMAFPVTSLPRWNIFLFDLFVHKYALGEVWGMIVAPFVHVMFSSKHLFSSQIPFNASPIKLLKPALSAKVKVA